MSYSSNTVPYTARIIDDLPLTSPRSGVGRQTDELFEAPEDLVCPITHAVFRSPCVTTVGTVYEEAAIRQHLTKSATDPLSNQPITDTQLIPVYLLRSRAKQYAIRTARTCIDRVLQGGCGEPARYLRRACDLCDEADVLDSMPSLSAKVVAFALSHRSQVHDVFILMQFATSLAESGYTSEALDVFCGLLNTEPDLPTQRAVIKRCLEHCWGANWSGDVNHEFAGAALNAAARRQCDGSPAHVRICDSLQSSSKHLHRCDKVGVHAKQTKLHEQWGSSTHWSMQVARFVRMQQGMQSSAFVVTLQSMGVPRHELLALCSELIAPTEVMSATSDASDNAAASPSEIALVPTMLRLHAAYVADRLCAAQAESTAQLPCKSSGAANQRGGMQQSGAARKTRQLQAGKALAVGASVLGLLAPGGIGKLLSTSAVVWLAARSNANAVHM